MTVSSFVVGVAAATLLVGQPAAHGPSDVDLSVMLDASGVVEIWTIAHGANANDKSVDLLDADGNVLTTVAVAKAGSASATAAALKTAWNADAIAGAYATASVNTTTVTLTGTAKGRVFSVQDTTADSDTSYSNTQNATDDAEVLPGSPLCFTGVGEGGIPLVKAGSVWNTLSLREDTITVTYAANARYEAVVTFDGVEYRANTVAATDSATTADNLATALNAALPANSVLATGNGNGTITLTNEIVGMTHSAVAVNLMTYAANAAITVASVSAGENVADRFIGVLLRHGVSESGASGTGPKVAGKLPVLARARGQVAVDLAELNNGVVYLGTGASNAGKWYAASGADRAKVAIPGKGASVQILQAAVTSNPVRVHVVGALV